MNILSLFIIGSSLLSIIKENIVGVVLTLSILILFSYPLGKYILILLLKRTNFFVSLCIGLLLNILIIYWIIVLKISLAFFPFLIFLLCLLLSWKAKNIIATKMTLSKQMKVLFLFLFLYYLIPPLTWDYTFAREYDLFAVGLKQSNEFRLPLVESYYPPAVAILPAAISKVIPFLTINKIMINIYSLFPLFMVMFFYFFGKEVLEQERMGFFFAVAYAITAVSKNAIFGGAAWPALLSLVYSLTSIFFFFMYKKTNDKKNLVICASMIAGAVLSHIDTALVLVYAYIALFISWIISSENFIGKKFKVIKVFFFIGISAVLIISPFLINSMENKEKLQGLWTEEKWLEQQQGESHVKNFQEVMFLVGKISMFIAFFGIVYCITKIKKQENIFPLFLLLWSLVMVLQNSWTFVRLSKLVLPYYPLNILMWMDLAILLSFLGGYALFHLENLVKSKYFIIGIFVLVLFSYGSFETVNVEGVYPGQGGYIKRGLIAKGDYVSKGDMEIMEYLKNRKSGITLNNNLIVGTAIPAMSEQESYTHVYEESYFDPSKSEFFEERTDSINQFFANPISNSSFAFIKDKKFSYIFLTNEQVYGGQNKPYYYNPALIESGNYTIIKRSNGAKLLVLGNSKEVIKHFEVETYVDTGGFTGGVIKQYNAPAMIAKTVRMETGTKIVIPTIEIEEFINNPSTIYVKYTSFKHAPQLLIRNGDNECITKKSTNKIQFVETSCSFEIEDADIELTTNDNLLFIPLEIDWIEITKRE